ncbi:MAG: hypothetical protein R3C27_10815 [Hyphomonadaceae bacterium]
MAALPCKITAQEFVAMDLIGRRFQSREGRSQLRGAVCGAALHESFVTISVGSVQRQQGAAWNPLPDFDYKGSADTMSIWRAANGRVEIDIMNIGSIIIFPPGA